jgi:hypothetical protein
MRCFLEKKGILDENKEVRSSKRHMRCFLEKKGILDENKEVRSSQAI